MLNSKYTSYIGHLIFHMLEIITLSLLQCSTYYFCFVLNYMHTYFFILFLIFFSRLLVSVIRVQLLDYVPLTSPSLHKAWIEQISGRG